RPRALLISRGGVLKRHYRVIPRERSERRIVRPSLVASIRPLTRRFLAVARNDNYLASARLAANHPDAPRIPGPGGAPKPPRYSPSISMAKRPQPATGRMNRI